MSRGSAFSGLANHFLLVLQLNVRSKQALIYGYLVPVFFLLAFGSVFPAYGRSAIAHRNGSNPDHHHPRRRLCSDCPPRIVAERERGVWRRYRLLPVPILSIGP